MPLNKYIAICVGKYPRATVFGQSSMQKPPDTLNIIVRQKSINFRKILD